MELERLSDEELLVLARERRGRSACSTGATSTRCRAIPAAGLRVETAFDLTAETFAAALRAVPRYEPRPEPARAWLFGIARNTLSEALRRGQVQDRARRALAMEPIVLDETDIETLELLAETPAVEAVASLPDDQRAAVLARHVEASPTRRSPSGWRARRASCASASAAGCAR